MNEIALDRINNLINPNTQVEYSTSEEIRIKRSKFTRLIKDLTDDELSAVCVVLLGDQKIKDVIDCYSKAADNTIQLKSLQKEMNFRMESRQGV